MEGQMHPQQVADALVDQYYVILKECPENLHKFYQESSLVAWSEFDGGVVQTETVTTLTGINDMVMSSSFKNCHVEINAVDSQESIEGGVIVGVTGYIVMKDGLEKNFNQIFFLAKQEKGFFVFNDILRINDFLVNAVDTSDQTTSTIQVSVPSVVSNSPAVNNDSFVEKKDAKEAVDLSASKETNAEVETPKIPAASPKKVGPVPAPVSNVKVDAPKISYASMVARVNPMDTSKTVQVSSNADNQSFGTSVTKPSKVAMPNGAASSVPSNGNGASNGSALGEGREIYIGGLPTNITENGIVDVIKQFGAVKKSSDCVRIRRHEDGFCCAFVEFEFAASALRAVKAHNVMFGDKEAYVTFRRPPTNRGNEGAGRSLVRTGHRNGNANGSRSSYSNGQARGSQSKPSEQWSKVERKAKP